MEAVLSDFHTIKEGAKQVGLELNLQKCELFIFGASESERSEALETFKTRFPDLSTPLADKAGVSGSAPSGRGNSLRS